MKSLFNIGETAKKAIIALAIVSSLAFSIAAQKAEPQSQGKMYGEPGFRGEPINLNVVNADIRDILSYITDQYGINFVIDKSVKEVPVTVKVNDVPWNVALDSVLQAQALGVQVNGNILRIADNKTLADEGELYNAKMNNQLDTSPLYTELIRLNSATGGQGTQAASTTAGTTTSSSVMPGGRRPTTWRRCDRNGCRGSRRGATPPQASGNSGRGRSPRCGFWLLALRERRPPQLRKSMSSAPPGYGLTETDYATSSIVTLSG